MQLTEFQFVCEWCGLTFIRRHARGRRPLYCNHVCRQRAYEERRRGALALGLPKATVCELLQLCGARVKPGNRPFYLGPVTSGRRNCGTCSRVARQFPLERRIEPLSDIGTATALIGMLRATRQAPEPALRAQVDQLLSAFGAPAGAAFSTSEHAGRPR